MKTSKVKKAKRFSIALSDREGELLKLFCADHNMTRSVAIRRILREHLKQYEIELSKQQPANQLGLFDSVQIDIFNNTSITKKDSE